MDFYPRILGGLWCCCARSHTHARACDCVPMPTQCFSTSSLIGLSFDHKKPEPSYHSFPSPSGRTLVPANQTVPLGWAHRLTNQSGTLFLPKNNAAHSHWSLIKFWGGKDLTNDVINYYLYFFTVYWTVPSALLVAFSALPGFALCL
ncbi:hypothetical protein XENTR_v10003296 [Xenopus tropicalis]|nr:hypothetical protein XENTR_v10003296 [Xenopus tropicalis]